MKLIFCVRIYFYAIKHKIHFPSLLSFMFSLTNKICPNIPIKALFYLELEQKLYSSAPYSLFCIYSVLVIFFLLVWVFLFFCFCQSVPHRKLSFRMTVVTWQSMKIEPLVSSLLLQEFLGCLDWYLEIVASWRTVKIHFRSWQILLIGVSISYAVEIKMEIFVLLYLASSL